VTRSILRGIKDKQTRELIRGLMDEGWSVSITGNNHVKVTAPNGRFVITSLSSSDRRGWRQFERNVNNIKAGRPTS